MLSIKKLLPKLRADYPAISWQIDEVFRWEPGTGVVSYVPNGPVPLLLHELSHALLGHADYTRDMMLLRMEREAWEHARMVLGPLHGVKISDETIEEAIDTYRDWLHTRSLCPTCETTGIQISRLLYECPLCHTKWQPNQAKHCALRRFVVKTQKASA